MTSVENEQQHTLGMPVPPFTAHAISVSLPTWRDNVGYEEGEKRVVDAMVSGYPRFFIHLGIRKLAAICEQRFGTPGELCILCPTRRIAEYCRTFMVERSTQEGAPVPVRLVQFLICPEDGPSTESTCIELHIVFFPADSFPLAKQFWQHTGLGISSRLAEKALSMLPSEATPPTTPVAPSTRPMVKPGNRHYSKLSLTKSPPASPSLPNNPPPSAIVPAGEDESVTRDQFTYLEERYGRNMPLESAAAAKRALRRRIAGVLVRDNPSDWTTAGGEDASLGPSTRGVEGVTESDVFLYSTGMSAIWSAHQLALAVRPAAKSVCFGFPYGDTLKVLQKWGPGCHFLGHGLDKDIDELELILEREAAASGGPPVLALFTEFPSNPLLRTADLPRLRALADKYDFPIVVDDTVGNFVNVEVLPFADIVVSSLTKIFSGDANVMSGSLVLNPQGRHYAALKAHLAAHFEDSYFDEDAIYLERNSRDFRRRIKVVDDNTLAVCDFLRARGSTVTAVYYPKFSSTVAHYERCRTAEGGYGGLFSISLASVEAARAFYDALPFMKGPSLGTNFTLACPYTILVHYLELDWAAGYGVEEGLVRVSVGLEDRQVLLDGFEKALSAAEAVLKATGDEA